MPKIRTTVSLDRGLYLRARSEGLNISQIANEALAHQVGHAYSEGDVEELKKRLRAMEKLQKTEDREKIEYNDLITRFMIYMEAGFVRPEESIRAWVTSVRINYPALRTYSTPVLMQMLREEYEKKKDKERRSPTDCEPKRATADNLPDHPGGMLQCRRTT